MICYSTCLNTLVTQRREVVELDKTGDSEVHPGCQLKNQQQSLLPLPCVQCVRRTLGEVTVTMEDSLACHARHSSEEQSPVNQGQNRRVVATEELAPARTVSAQFASVDRVVWCGAERVG